MAAPAKKRAVKGVGKVRSAKKRIPAAESQDADLLAFREASGRSRRAIAKELDQLIRPAE